MDTSNIFKALRKEEGTFNIELQNEWLRFLEGRDYEYSTYLNTNDETGNPQFTIENRCDESEFGAAQEKAITIFLENQDYFYEACTQVLLDKFPQLLDYYGKNKFLYESMDKRVVEGFLPKKEAFNYKEIKIDLDNVVRLTGPNLISVDDEVKEGLAYLDFHFYSAFDIEYDIILSFHGKEFLFFDEPGDR